MRCSMSLKSAFFVIVAMLLMAPAATAAYDVKTIKKEKKDFMEQIKKQRMAKKITPVVTEDGSYYYFLIENKDKRLGVVDDRGWLIVPMEYDMIVYLPPVEEGCSKIRCTDIQGNSLPGKFYEIYHAKAGGSFFASTFRGGDFYDLSANKVSSTKQNSIDVMPGYAVTYSSYPPKSGEATSLYSEYTKRAFFSRSGTPEYSQGLYSCNGKPIVANFTYLSFHDKESFMYKKAVDGVEKEGYYHLTNPQLNIPCIFNGIVFQGGKILVQKNANDILEPYNAEMNNQGINYRDEGERLFNQRKWDDVISYYQANGIDAPWATYISAAALFEKAEKTDVEISIFLNNANSSTTLLPYMLKSKLYDPRNLQIAHECRKSAKMLNDAYLAGSDSTYRHQALVLEERVNYALSEFDKEWNLYAQIRQNTQMQLDAQEAQQQQMILNFLSAACNTFTQSLSKSSGSKSSSGTVRSSGGGTGVQSSQSTASKPDNSGRKSFLRGEIATWKNKFKKAEAAYQQALSTGDDTWEKKRVIDSKRKTVDECLEMIRQYEAELNSL